MPWNVAAAESLQSCPTLCDPRDGSPPGSPVPGILQARILEWVAISFSNAWKWKVKVKSLSHAWLLVTLWTAAYQAPPSMGFSRQEYWSGVPLWTWRLSYWVKSERERQISYGISYAWNLKYVMKQFIYNREKDTQIQKTNLRLSGERMLGREGLGVWS